MADFKWKVGFLNGFGDAVWQEAETGIRRITKMVNAPGGMSIFVKALPCVLSEEEWPEFPASMVIHGINVKEALIPDLVRCWEGGRIIPGTNGGPHPRFTQ